MRFRIDTARERDTIPRYRLDILAVAMGAKEVSVAILRSVDGKVFEIPDDKLSQFELPEELVAQIAGAMDPGPEAGPPGLDGPDERPGPDASPREDMAGPDGGPPDEGPCDLTSG